MRLTYLFLSFLLTNGNLHIQKITFIDVFHRNRKKIVYPKVCTHVHTISSTKLPSPAPSLPFSLAISFCIARSHTHAPCHK